MEDFGGNNTVSVLINDVGGGGGGGSRGGVVVAGKRCCGCWLARVIVSIDVRLPFHLTFTGRGGIGGGVDDILSDEALALVVY